MMIKIVFDKPRRKEPIVMKIINLGALFVAVCLAVLTRTSDAYVEVHSAGRSFNQCRVDFAHYAVPSSFNEKAKSALKKGLFIYNLYLNSSSACQSPKNLHTAASAAIPIAASAFVTTRSASAVPSIPAIPSDGYTDLGGIHQTS